MFAVVDAEIIIKTDVFAARGADVTMKTDIFAVADADMIVKTIVSYGPILTCLWIIPKA